MYVYLYIECPKGICRMKCPNGFQKDSNGCEICKCKFRCPLAGCLIFCEHGKKTDANGCEKCECNAAPKRGKCFHHFVYTMKSHY